MKADRVDFVAITKPRLVNLLQDEEKLRRLEAGGVDNWDGYWDSLNPQEEFPLEERYQQIEYEVDRL